MSLTVINWFEETSPEFPVTFTITVGGWYSINGNPPRRYKKGEIIIVEEIL